MSEALLRPDMREVIQHLASELPRAQQRLDTAHLEAVEAFAPLLDTARRAGFEGLARSLAPQRQLAGEYSASLQFHAAQTSERQHEIRVGIINLGYASRHAAAQFATSRLTVTVRQVPFEPGTRGDR
jgi:hypothetical protein